MERISPRAAGSPRGRYAPSPTGRLHVGNARTALLAWLSCRARGGTFVLRSEDLDSARVLPDGETALMEDLAWLGLDWDEGPERDGGGGGPFGPYRQSERSASYDAAIDRLLRGGKAYPCACSRAEVARAASAPHGPEDEGPRYSGTCRRLAPDEVAARARAASRDPAIRFASEGERIAFVDEVHGVVAPLGPLGVDDFVLRRADGVAAYQLAVVVDDAAMRIDEVVRGDDLLASTPRQIALYRALELPLPTFAHVPLLLDASGERLAKRTRPPSLASLREGGTPPAVVVGRLAASAGLCPPDGRLSARDLLSSLSAGDIWARLDRRPAVWMG